MEFERDQSMDEVHNYIKNFVSEVEMSWYDPNPFIVIRELYSDYEDAFEDWSEDREADGEYENMYKKDLADLLEKMSEAEDAWNKWNRTGTYVIYHDPSSEDNNDV